MSSPKEGYARQKYRYNGGMVRVRPDFQKKCQEVAERINARLAAVKPPVRKLKEIGTSADALRKQNVARYVTLAELAELLETTPNWLLGVSHEGVIGLLEAISLSYGLPLPQATLLAEAIVAVLDSPVLYQSYLPLREAARQAGLLLIEQARAAPPPPRRK